MKKKKQSFSKWYWGGVLNLRYTKEVLFPMMICGFIVMLVTSLQIAIARGSIEPGADVMNGLRIGLVLFLLPLVLVILVYAVYKIVLILWFLLREDNK